VDPPDGRTIKINIDGAFNKETGRAAVGIIAGDERGRPLFALWRLLNQCRDVEEAEATACLEGIKLGQHWPDRQIILESDCAQIVTKLRHGPWIDHWWRPSFATPYRRALFYFQCVVIRLGAREQNKEADELGQLAMRSDDMRYSSESVPDCIRSVLYCDVP
jgi:ribonuclease HI